jgi:hypothetical protein
VTPAIAATEIVERVGVGVGVGVEVGEGEGEGAAAAGTGGGGGVAVVIDVETADSIVGARVGLDAIDAGDAPLLFIAITEKEYKFPGVRPETLAALI